MKMSLDWHKNCLNNMRASHARCLEHIRSEQTAADNLLRDIIRKEGQIAAAEKAGKDGFDEERYLQPKIKSV